MEYQKVLAEIAREVEPFKKKGKVADYIPALARISPHQFGMAVHTLAGETAGIGDCLQSFSIQSISKLFSVALALKEKNDGIWTRIGREPSGNPFNSLVQLEFEQGIPRNPFINAGALVIADYLLSRYPNTRQTLLDFVRDLAGNRQISYDMEVMASEKKTGFRNAAMANFLKSFNNLNNDVDEVLDLYYHLCSITMTCRDLAAASLFLANKGIHPATGKMIVEKRQAKKINSLLLTCGTYDAVGDFAYRVGLPAKSGVGGGIVAILPGRYAVSVWSPALNKAGNSYAGTKALELFTTKTETSIF